MKPISYYNARKAKKLYALVNAMARVNGNDTTLKDFAAMANALAVAIEIEANCTVTQLITKMRRKLNAIRTAATSSGDLVVQAFVADADTFLAGVMRDVKYAEA